MTVDFKIDNDKLARVIAMLTSVYNNGSRAEFEKAKALMESAAEIPSMVHPVRADQVTHVKGDFYESDTPWLDEWLGGGPRRKEVMVIGGAPFSGKTHLMVWFAARYPGAKVAYFFGEDMVEDIHLYFERAGGPRLLQNTWLIDVQDYSFTVATVEGVVMQLEREGNKPDIVVLDHFDLMKSIAGTGGDWLDAAGVARESKVLAKRQDIIVVGGSQLHPGSRERKGFSRFYRAQTGKAANFDLVLMVDDVQDNEYRMSRQKAKGRDVSFETANKTLLVDWRTMKIEESRYD